MYFRTYDEYTSSYNFKQVSCNQKTVLSACESHKETMSKVNIKKDLDIIYYYMYVIIDPLVTSRTTDLDMWEERWCCIYQTVFKIIIASTTSGELQRNR